MVGSFELPIYIKIRPSIWLTIGLLAVHIGAIFMLGSVNFSLWIKLFLVAAIIISLLHTFRYYIWQNSPNSPVELILNAYEEWLLILANGSSLEVKLMPAAFVHPLLVVLPFRQARSFPTVILTPDRVDPDSFRRLRVRLRFKRNTTSS